LSQEEDKARRQMWPNSLSPTGKSPVGGALAAKGDELQNIEHKAIASPLPTADLISVDVQRRTQPEVSRATHHCSRSDTL